MFPFLYRSISALINELPVQQGKLAVSLAGRRAAVGRWIEWASRNRTKSPLIWVHGASVGEHLSATPVITRLSASIPGLQVVRSHTSPSVPSWRKILDTDQVDYIPPEHPDSIRQVLESLRPNLVVFSRGDLWPVLAKMTTNLRIPMAVIGGTVSPSSRRLWPLARRILAPAYQSLSWLGAISQGDAERWIALGARASATEVTGDPRHDQVLERPTELRDLTPFLEWSRGYTVLVAGSTGERDEQVLLEAYAGMVRSNECRTRLMIVPHEVSGSRAKQVQEVADRLGVGADIWAGGTLHSQARCVVINKMGLLADLYAVAQIAYVGGGLSRGGLHSVIEPAAYAVPVIAGRKNASSRDFDLLLQNNGAVALPEIGTVGELQRTWTTWSQNAQTRVETGLRARNSLRQGAASDSAQALLLLLKRSTN